MEAIESDISTWCPKFLILVAALVMLVVFVAVLAEHGIDEQPSPALASMVAVSQSALAGDLK